MDTLEKIINTIDKYYNPEYCNQIFFTKNSSGDELEVIGIINDRIHIEFCSYYGYFEISGLTDAEEDIIYKHYRYMEYVYNATNGDWYDILGM